MKKYAWVIGLVIIAVLLISCFLLWRQVGVEHTKMVDLCQTSAYQSLENFKKYSAKGEDYLYTYGVAEFRSFMDAYLYLNDNVSDTEYRYCNIIYGEMVLNPERLQVQVNMQKLIEALEILAEDYTDPNGYICLNELGNHLRYVEG